MKKILAGILAILFIATSSFALINDRNIDWRRGRIFIPAPGFAGYVAQNGVDDGAPVLAEISTFGFVGLTMAATGDSVSTYMPVPRDLDILRPTYFRVHYTLAPTNETITGTEEATWAVTYDRTAINTSLEAAATTLTTTIAADVYTPTVGMAWAATPWGVVSAETFSEAQFLALNVELDNALYGALDAYDSTGTEMVRLLGLEIEFTPKKTKYGAMEFEAPR